MKEVASHLGMCGGRDICRFSHQLNFSFTFDSSKFGDFRRKPPSPATWNKLDEQIKVGLRNTLVIEGMEEAFSSLRGCEY